MICAACQSPNEADARFCEGCGAALERRCAACGTPASATARFCRSCGGALAGAVAPAPESPTRKTVTVLFADLAGSTTFEEKVDAETAREVLGRYHALLRETAERHRAGTVKYIGDGFMAVWGVPEIGVGDADHAVDAAVELQERFVDLAASVAHTHSEHLALRVAVNTGEVVVGADDADLVGDALNVAARLESECPHGQVVVGEETWRHTRGRYRYEAMAPVQVKGRAAPVAVYQWAGGRSEPADSVPFVGRAGESRRLHAVLDDAVSQRTARLVTIIGDPGVGKSRLAAEFTRAHPDALVLQIRCAAEGTVALAPVVEVLRMRDLEADVAATVPERDRILRDLTAMTGGVAGSVEETFWGLRRYFEVLAGGGPLVLILDDIHWADALLLDFIEHLAEWVRDAPILMIALARPEIRDKRPELLTVGGWVGDAIRLGGLEPAATAELAARVLGSGRLPAELQARLPSSTGGNPLFVRELVAMLVHDGVLVERDESWRLTIDVDAIAVPPTIHALLASRLERLAGADRRVLQTAAVIGADFSPSAVCALSGAAAADVKAALDRLRQLELAQPSGTYVGDEPVWRFHHILIRDVAYRRLLKSDRAELHERFADWIENGRPGGVFESDELVARHLESAHGYRGDLGARDAHTTELALRAARRYLAAARRALDRDALVSAGAQAARGAALADADPALRSELLMIGCEAYLSAGDVAAGASLVDELERAADDSLSPWATCYRCQYIVYTDPTRLPEIDGLLPGAIDEFTRRGDAAGLAKAYRVRANARARLGRIGDCESDLFEALIAARKAGDHRQITASLGAAPNAALWGPSPAPKAGGRCLDVVRMQRMTTAAPSLEATSLRCLAVLELLRGRPDKARSMLSEAREIVSDLGLRHGLMETELYAGIIELLVGEPVAAEPHFRTALEGLDSLGVGSDAGQAAALLARSLLAQGRIVEADRYASESERIAGHNLKTAIGWRAVRAEILSAQGRHDEAAARARDAVEVAAETDLLLDYADANLTLSRVLAAAGDRMGATEARAKAESLYAAKDAVFLVGECKSGDSAEAAAAPVTDAAASRLSTANRAGETPALALQDRLRLSSHYVYEDRRRVPGDPLRSSADWLAAATRKLAQYPHAEAPVLAARGDRLALVAMRWWDDAGNETASLDVYELNEAGELRYTGRFDEDDFASAYTEMEERYYAGEGAAFAVTGLRQVQFQKALWAQDLESAQRVVTSDFCWCAGAAAFKSDRRSLGEVFAWRAERLRQVASFEDWVARLEWLSPDCFISLCDIRGRGDDGEEFRWPRILVTHCRDGLGVSCHEFDVEDEDAAFAYAESLVAPRRRRLVVANSASRVADGLIAALSAGDGAVAAAFYAETLSYDDRRRLQGNGMTSRADLRRAADKAVEQYGRFENDILAVRGDRYCLTWSRWSDTAGNQTAHLHVFELDGDGLICYEGRFDEGDFLTAYAEMEQRYYTGEGVGFATSGHAVAAWVQGIGHNDVVAVRRNSTWDFLWHASESSFKDRVRTVDEMFAWRDQRAQQVSAQRHSAPVIRWLSPDCAVGRLEISAVGEDGEPYVWVSFGVTRFRDGLVAAIHEFDTEEEAFAFAESLASAPSRLAMTNRAGEAGHRIIAHVRNGNFDLAAACYANNVDYEDHRHISGSPVAGRENVRAAFERVAKHYGHFDLRTLAVRGERLHLGHCRWSDADGNQTSYFDVHEVDEEGLVVYDGRFDEDDFEGAYLELERRYYAGEGVAYAEASALLKELFTASSRGDLDTIFGTLFAPDLQVESRSRTIIPDRTAAELRSSFEEFAAMVAWSRVWDGAVHWLSPNWVVIRQEREAIGHDGGRFEWTRIYVGESRNGRVTTLCEFDLENEADAFAYAEERMRLATNRLAVANRATATAERLADALRAGDLDRAAAQSSPDCVHEDRRALSGDPISGPGAIRDALTRVARQYSGFRATPIAVRGDGLALGRAHRCDETGNESTLLIVAEVDDEDRFIAYISFDEDDFDGAYAELERRYYAGEGAAFAAAGTMSSGFITALNSGDLDGALGAFSRPGFVIENRSRAVFPDRTVSEVRRDVEGLVATMSTVRWWHSVLCWLSPTVCVARQEREALGPEGQVYSWTDIYAAEFLGESTQWVCRFNIEDEKQAFAAAEERVARSRGQLPTSNRASAIRLGVTEAIQRGDIEGAVAPYVEDLVYEDHRSLSGDAPVGRAGMHSAFARLRRDYRHFGGRFLAVRGERLALGEYVCSDDAGNRTTGLTLTEIDQDGLIIYEGRFDDADFEAAYSELERRYSSGEGAPFAEFGAVTTRYFLARNRGDLDTVFTTLITPDFRLESRSGSVFVGRSAAEHRASIEELGKLVGSVREWMSAVHYVSGGWGLGRYRREATGPDGENYQWDRIVVAEVRDGRLAYVCDFDFGDEEAAFAFAEERARKSRTRLAVTNRATEVLIALIDRFSSGNAEAVADHYRSDYLFEDHRRICGGPLCGVAAMRSAVERILAQYSDFDWRVLAVRGERSTLHWSQWRDESGNETTHLHLVEIDESGRIFFEARFDGDDFDSAYRELERRYFAGEGAAYAVNEHLQCGFIEAVNSRDRAAAGKVCLPSIRITSPPAMLAAEDRSLEEFFCWLDERAEQAPSVRHWMSAVHWLSVHCEVLRIEIRALGADGDDYTWPRLAVGEIRGGRLAQIRQFEIDDEEAAFAYAETIVAKDAGRLPLRNIAAEAGEAAFAAVDSGDVEAVLDFYADDFVFDDHRRLNGDPIRGKAAMRAAFERILCQFTTFELQGLAVRGARLALGSSRWADAAGNESTHLHLVEVGDDGRLVYDGRFDADDFESAYGELERRYYAGEGAPFAENGLVSARYVSTMNHAEWDTAFYQLTRHDMRVENHSRSAFPNRTAVELRRSFEELHSMVGSLRSWFSAVTWIAPALAVTRMERDGVGPGGEKYEWSRILVMTWQGGKLAALGDFDSGDEDTAFAYAEAIVSQHPTRLPSTNWCSERAEAANVAMASRDIDETLDFYSQDCLFDDHRRLSGDPIIGLAARRAAFERLCAQFSSFEPAVVAVRGERVMLGRTRWSDEAGNQSTYLHVLEIDDAGRICYAGRFDDDDFYGAYAEMERRYYTGEGAAFAGNGMASTRLMATMSHGDFDTMFNDLIRPDFHIDNRSRSAFPDRSAGDLRASFEGLYAMLTSVRTWFPAVTWISPTTAVSSFEREGVGLDGEPYAWSRVFVATWQDGQLVAMGDFDAGDEDAAFAYAESIE